MRGSNVVRQYKVDEYRSQSTWITSGFSGLYDDMNPRSDCWNQPPTNFTRGSAIYGCFPSVLNAPFRFPECQSSGSPSNESNPKNRLATFLLCEHQNWMLAPR